MSKKFTTTINIDEIRSVFEEFCKETGEIFREAHFIKFLKFLEIDFYDWVKGNLNQFNKK